MRTPEEHGSHLREIQEVLRKNELYAKSSKCEFWLEKVVFLGHIVSMKGISVDPEKIEAVMQRPRAKNVTEMRSILSLAGFYRKFVRHFS